MHAGAIGDGQKPWGGAPGRAAGGGGLIEQGKVCLWVQIRMQGELDRSSSHVCSLPTPLREWTPAHDGLGSRPVLVFR